MAWEEVGPFLGFPSSADYSAATGTNAQKLAVALNNSGQVVVAGANVRILGILIDDPKAGMTGTVQHRDVAKAIAGAAIANAWTPLKTNASGQLVPATNAGTDLVVAYALAPASGAGSVIPVKLNAPGTYL